MLPRPVIWPGGNSDIYSDASGLSFPSHSAHIPPELPALFPPAERALANLFMQGWQWKQPDLLQEKTAKGFGTGSPSVARWMMLEGICRAGCAGRAAEWGWLAASWTGARHHHGCLLLTRQQRILLGLLSGWALHTIHPCSSLPGCLPGAERACWAEGAQRKEGRKRAWCSAAWHFSYIFLCLQLLVKSGWHHTFQRGPRSPLLPAAATSSLDARSWAIQFTFCMAWSSCTTFPYAIHLIQHFNVLVSRNGTSNRTVKKGRANGYLWLSIKPNCSRRLGSPEVTSWQRTWNIISTLANYPVSLLTGATGTSLMSLTPNQHTTFPPKVISKEKLLYSVLQGYKKRRKQQLLRISQGDRTIVGQL